MDRDVDPCADTEEIRIWVDASSPGEAIEKALARTEDSGTPNRRASIAVGLREDGRYLVLIEEDGTVGEPTP